MDLQTTKAENVFWLVLSEEQKEEIAISRQQISHGETQDWKVLRKKLL